MDPRKVTDSQLLIRFEEGRDQDAFAEIVRRHGPMVLSTIRRVLAQEDEFEEAFQATFFALATSIGKLRKLDAVGGWLHKAALSSAKQIQRSNVRWQEKRERMKERLESSENSVISADNNDPSSSIAHEEIEQILDEELARLPTKLHAVIVVCHLEGLSHSQAAKELGIPASTVNDRLASARKLLHGRLVRRGVSLSLSGLASCMAMSSETASAVTSAIVAETTEKATLFAAGKTASQIGVATTVTQTAKEIVSTMATSKLLSTLVIAVAIVFAAGILPYVRGVNSSAVAGTILSDDFDGSFDGSWEIVAGNGDLEIVNGRLNVTPSDRNAIVIQPFREDGTAFRLEDTVINTRFNIPDGMQAQVGLIVRGDGYSAAIDTFNAAGLFQGPNFQEVDADSRLTFDIGGQDIDVQFKAIGADVSFSVWPTQDTSNRVILNGDDAEPMSGRFAIYIRAFGGSLEAVQIDEFVVVPEPSSANMVAALLFVLAIATPTLRTFR